MCVRTSRDAGGSSLTPNRYRDSYLLLNLKFIVTLFHFISLSKYVLLYLVSSAFYYEFNFSCWWTFFSARLKVFLPLSFVSVENFCTIYIKEEVCSFDEKRWTIWVHAIAFVEGVGKLLRSCYSMWAVSHYVKNFMSFQQNAQIVAITTVCLRNTMLPRF